MDFQNKMHNQIMGMKNWIYSHMHKHNCPSHCDLYHNAEHYMNHIHCMELMSFLPEKVTEDMQSLCMQEHEKFLGEHFKFAKKLKELEHKASILELDIKEHWLSKKNDFDKKVMHDSIKELRKVKLEMTDLINEEKNRFMKSVKSTEEKVFNKIEDFLKK